MKKKVLGIAAAAIAAAAMAACSGGTNTTADTTEAVAETAEAASESAAATEETAAESGETEAAAEDGAGAKAEGDSFIVGFDQDFPPMGFLGDDGEYTGFDLELAQEVANRLGLGFQPQPIAWDAKDMELEAGNIDCIWNGFTMNGREDSYTWSDPYMDNSQVIVVAPDSGIGSLADLAGKVVEVQVDSSAQAALEENEELTGTFAQLVTTPDYNTAFMDLEQGAVDAIAMDVIVAGYQIQQRQSDFVILDETIASEVYGIGFKKGNTGLRDQVQAVLEEMAADGTMTEISEKWFGEDVTIIGKDN